MGSLLWLMRRRWDWIALSAGAVTVSCAVTLWWNEVLRGLINTVSAGAAAPTPAVLTAVLAMAASAAAALGVGLCTGWTCETLAHDLRMGLARGLSALPIEQIQTLNAGAQVSLLQNEIADVSAYLRDNLFQLIGDAMRFVATLAWLVHISPELSLWTTLPSLAILGIAVLTSRSIGAAALRSQQANQRGNGFADALLGVFPVLKVFEAAPMLLGRYDDALRDWETATVAEERRRAVLMSFSAVLGCLPLLLLFLVGGGQVIAGRLDVGAVYIFLNLSGNVSGVLGNLPGRIGGFRRFAANLARLQPNISRQGGQ